jgi:hypothetical protein
VSAAPDGYNPMRWRCADSGCFNEKMRPKIEVFAAFLPKRIAMSDVDGTVEINGYFLFLEFKSGLPRELPLGQKIYFDRLTRTSPRIVVVVVCANAETMEVTHLMVVHGGIFGASLARRSVGPLGRALELVERAAP